MVRVINGEWWWVFGGIEVGPDTSNNLFYVVVDQRDSVTINDSIKSHIKGEHSYTVMSGGY